MAKFFTIQSTKLNVDREKRRINGVAIATIGDANGDTIDAQTLQMLAALGAPGGVRARYDHPNRANPHEVEQTLDNLLGEWVDFRLEGPVCRADCQMAGINIDKEDKVMDWADKAPHLFGTSIVFDDSPLPKGQKPKRGTPCRPVKLYTADFVDLPAANNAGLFAAMSAEGQMMKTDMCAKDGKLYCTVDGKEYELESNEEAFAAHKVIHKASKAEGNTEGEEAETEAAKKKAAEKPKQETTVSDEIALKKVADDAVAAERGRRKKFSEQMKTAGVTDPKDVAELEDLYESGVDEKAIEKVTKLFGARKIESRARAVGDGSGDPEKKDETEAEKLEKQAGERFDAEPSVRRMYGVVTSNKSADDYKTARGRYVAAARRQSESK